MSTPVETTTTDTRTGGGGGIVSGAVGAVGSPLDRWAVTRGSSAQPRNSAINTNGSMCAAREYLIELLSGIPMSLVAFVLSGDL